MASALLQRVQHVLALHSRQNDDRQNNDQQNVCPSETLRQAAVLLALTDEASPHLLMIRRGLNLPIHPGEIAFPGGKHDEGDADLFATALREAREEVSLPSESVRFAGRLSPHVSVSNLFVMPIVAVIPPNLPLRAQAGEVGEILYVPLAFFAEAKHLRADRILTNTGERISARFQYAHYTIWGLTGRFIVQLVNCLYNADLDIELRAQHALKGAI